MKKLGKNQGEHHKAIIEETEAAKNVCVYVDISVHL